MTTGNMIEKQRRDCFATIQSLELSMSMRMSKSMRLNIA